MAVGGRRGKNMMEQREREREKDLRRWRASPLINHTRLYYFPFKLPPFRWPEGERERGNDLCKGGTKEEAEREGSLRPPSSRTTSSARYKHVSRELELEKRLCPPLLLPFIHHSASYHLDSFLFRLSFHLAILLYRYRPVQELQRSCFAGGGKWRKCEMFGRSEEGYEGGKGEFFTTCLF